MVVNSVLIWNVFIGDIMIIHKALILTEVIIYQISSLSEIEMMPLDAADTICLMACLCFYEFLRDEREGVVQRSTDLHLMYQIVSVYISKSCIFYVVNRTILRMQLPV